MPQMQSLLEITFQIGPTDDSVMFYWGSFYGGGGDMSKTKVLFVAWIALGVAVAGAAYLVTMLPQPAYAAMNC
jgi:hypothetical protein